MVAVWGGGLHSFPPGRVRIAEHRIILLVVLPYHLNPTPRSNLPLDLPHASTIQTSPIHPIHTSIRPLLNIQVASLALPFSYSHQWCVVLGRIRHNKKKQQKNMTIALVPVSQCLFQANNSDFWVYGPTTFLNNLRVTWPRLHGLTAIG